LQLTVSFLSIASEFWRHTLEIIFDNVEKVHSKIAKAMDYVNSDPNYGHMMGSEIPVRSEKI